MTLTVEEILVKMIKSISLFSWIGDKEALELAKQFKLNYYPKWSLIIREWANPDKIYILKNWKLEARKAHWLSNIVLGEIKPWEIFWEMSFFYGRPAMASVVATEDSDVWEISRDVFKNFLEKYPNVKETAERIMKEREAINIQRLKFEPSESDNLDDDIRIIL